MVRILLSIFLSIWLGTAAFAQEAAPDASVDRSATGGAQTLDDILARQKGESIDDDFRRNAIGNADSAAGIAAQLGTLGGASDSELWRSLRYGSADITVSAGGAPARVLVQDSGMRWLAFREGPLASKGAYGLIGMLVLLTLFYMMRGRIMIDGEKTGRTVLRFKSIERFGHWLMAGSFIVLGLTGLFTLYARKVFLGGSGGINSAEEIMARQNGALIETLLGASKWVHNNISWAFMIGLAMVFVMWVVHNLPNRTDLVWLAKGGGIFTDDHPPAKKFNAGQKMIFWSVVGFGGLISLTGLSLLFPFELPMFANIFGVLNQTGVPQLFGFGELPTVLAPHEEMQYAQIWHAVLAFVLMAIILAHIYIGSVGMEGAYDAMGSGQVDEEWARQHHSLWLEDVQAKDAETPQKATTPAE